MDAIALEAPEWPHGDAYLLDNTSAAATLRDPVSGRTMVVETTEPICQTYFSTLLDATGKVRASLTRKPRTLMSGLTTGHRWFNGDGAWPIVADGTLPGDGSHVACRVGKGTKRTPQCAWRCNARPPR